MRLRGLLGGACCLALVACGGDADTEAEAAEPTAMVDDGAALDALTEYFETHYNMQHASMVADELYAADATWLAANGETLSGRAEIEAYMANAMASMTPEVDINQTDRMVVGDMAVVRGTYSVTGEMDGQPAGFSGAFLNVARKADDKWVVTNAQTNYDTETSPALWVGVAEGTEPPAEEGMLQELAEAYETHYNLGHPDMVADFFTEDATVSFAGGPWISGRAAISASLAERIESGLTLDIHDIGSTAFGDDMVLDGGWYSLLSDGEQVGWGTYSALAKRTADGDYQIHWMVGNASPLPN